LRKIKILIFGSISKFLKLIVFGQILIIFGSFGLFWANSAAMAVVDSMPTFENKRKKDVITFAKSVKILHVMACWKAL
jgi:succinate-acetate transporter protein